MIKIGIALGLFIRIFLYFTGFTISIRYLNSPYTSLYTYEEGLAYIKNGLSPYFEDSPVHAPPILLYLYSFLSKRSLFIFLQFIDLISLYALNKITKVIPIKNPISVLFFYLNPFSIYMSITLSMTPLTICVLLLCIYFILTGRRFKTGYFLSILLYIDPSYGIIANL